MDESNLSMKKSKVDGRILNVVTYEEYVDHPELFQNSSTGVEYRKDGKTYVLPHRSGQYNPDRAGVYNSGPVDVFVLPNEEKEENYTQDIIDLNDVSGMAELAEKIDMVKDMERDILTSPDNIFTPCIGKKDSPEMRGLKQAVIAKNIDIDKYADRFGDNFPNDKRQFRKDNITLFMMKRMCKCLDMQAKLIIEDTNPNVPNPIGKQIVVDLTEIDDGD